MVTKKIMAFMETLSLRSIGYSSNSPFVSFVRFRKKSIVLNPGQVDSNSTKADAGIRKVVGITGQLPFGEICSHISLLMRAMFEVEAEEYILCLSEDPSFLEKNQFSAPFLNQHRLILEDRLPHMGVSFAFLPVEQSSLIYVSKLLKTVKGAREVILLGGSHRPWIAERLLLGVGQKVSYVATASNFELDNFPLGSIVRTTVGRNTPSEFNNFEVPMLPKADKARVDILKTLTEPLRNPLDVSHLQGRKVLMFVSRILSNHHLELAKASNKRFGDSVEIVLIGRLIGQSEMDKVELNFSTYLGFVGDLQYTIDQIVTQADRAAAFISPATTGSGAIIRILQSKTVVFGRQSSEEPPDSSWSVQKFEASLDEITDYLFGIGQ